MIEVSATTIQIAVLLICVAIALYRAIKLNSRAWTLVSFFYGGYLLGDLYMLLCIIFYEDSPQISVVSDLNWYAAYLLMYLLLREVAPPRPEREKRLLPWLGVAFALMMAAVYFSFYIYWIVCNGEYYVLWEKALTNLCYGSLMALLLFSTIRRLMDRRYYRSQNSLCVSILVFCLLEYSIWTSSCFWFSNSIKNPYYWFDFLLTISLLFFIPATKKAVAE